jgi:hypothetical protein
LASGSTPSAASALLIFDRRTAGSEIPAASSHAAESRMIDSRVTVVGFAGRLWK